MRSSVEQRVDELLGRHDAPVRGRLDARSSLLKLLELLSRSHAPTAVHDPGRGVDVHIADSLAGLEVPEVQAAELIADLGAGAGLPGLVLAAALPDARVVLVEAAARKCEFLRAAAAEMALDNAEVVWARAEEWSDGLGRCDVVTARALAAMPVLCEYAAPLLVDGGVLVAWKGAVSDAEAADEAAAAEHLGLRVEPVRSVIPYPGSERRTLHVLRKVASTPPNYPRRAGIATKRPLSATNLR
jgi:16S rRNA (guanine527-N7)-methyltransferase